MFLSNLLSQRYVLKQRKGQWSSGAMNNESRGNEGRKRGKRGTNGITSFKGVRRSIEMKFRQTGKRMKMASTWRTRAAARAMAVRREGKAEVSEAERERETRGEEDERGTN